MAKLADNPFLPGQRVNYLWKTGNMVGPRVIPATVIRPVTSDKTSIRFDTPAKFGADERAQLMTRNKMLRILE